MRPNLMSYSPPSRLNPKFFNADGTQTDFLSKLADKIKEHAVGDMSKSDRHSVYELYIVGSNSNGSWLEPSDLDVICVGSMPTEYAVITSDGLCADVCIMNENFAEDTGVDVPYGMAYDVLNRQWVCDASCLEKIDKLTDEINHSLDEDTLHSLYKIYYRAGNLYNIGRFRESLDDYKKFYGLTEGKALAQAIVGSKKYFDRLLELERMGMI